MSKIEQCIDELEAYLDGCKSKAFTNDKKVVVDRDEIDEILAELRESSPEEIRKYQRIVANQDAILNHAREQANATMNEAQDAAKDELLRAKKQAAELVEENTITQRAYKKADEILNDANNEAQQIVDQAAAEADSLRSRTVGYADDVLGSLEKVIQQCINDFDVRYDQLRRSLNNAHEIILADRRQLSPEKIYASDADEEEPEILNEGPAEGISLYED